MIMKEYKLGDKIVLEVVQISQSQSKRCNGCYFRENNCLCPHLLCGGFERSDGRNIIFKEVKE